MKVPSIALLCLVMTASFAGCFADDDASLSSAGTSTGASDNATLPTDNATANTAPTIVVTILINGTEVALVNDSYAVPVGENITFDASGSSDDESENLTFAWDFGDGNSSTESVAVYAYGAAGNFTVNITVTDVDGASASQELPLVVAPSGPAPGTPIRTEKKQFMGTVSQPVAEAFCGDSPAGGDNLSFKWELAAAEPDGTLVKITKFTMKITQSATNIDTDFYFNGPDGKEIGSSHAFEPIDGAEKGFSLDGEWLPGTYTVLVKSCGSVNNAVTIDMAADLVAA